jgi:hypothetical protein
MGENGCKYLNDRGKNLRKSIEIIYILSGVLHLANLEETDMDKRKPPSLIILTCSFMEMMLLDLYMLFQQ